MTLLIEEIISSKL